MLVLAVALTIRRAKLVEVVIDQSVDGGLSTTLERVAQAEREQAHMRHPADPA